MAKKNSGGTGTLPHEIMMEKFRKEGRVHREELSIKALTLDHQLQAREKPLDLNHVKELHGYLKDGAVFPPIVVFRVDGDEKNYVGNGFHRVRVHKNEGRESIKADVVSGTWQEAVEFATCCNFANSALTPTAEDRKKAVILLLANGWLNRSVKEIAKHAGVSDATVGKYITEYCRSTGSKRPEFVVGRDGSKRRTSYPGGSLSSNKRGGFRVGIAGKVIDVNGPTKQEAEARFSELKAKRDLALRGWARPGNVATKLARQSLMFNSTSTPMVIQGGVCGRFAVTVLIDDVNSMGRSGGPPVITAIGRAVLLGQHCGLALKVILVFEKVNSHEEILALARGLGVEFMTLDEFVEVAKADKVKEAGDEVFEQLAAS